MVAVIDGGRSCHIVMAAYLGVDGIVHGVYHQLYLALCTHCAFQIAALDDFWSKEKIIIANARTFIYRDYSNQAVNRP